MVSSQLPVEAPGDWAAPDRVEVTEEWLDSYATTMGEPAPGDPGGNLLLFPFVVAIPSLRAVNSSLPWSDQVPAWLHGEHDLWVARPVRPGDVLTTRSRLTGILEKSFGTLVIADGVTTDADGRLFAHQIQVAIAFGFRGCTTAGRPAPGHSLPARGGSEPLIRFKQNLDRDLPRRYAAPGRDSNPIHLDPAAARAAGLPGTVVHGACLLGMVACHLAGRTGAAGLWPRRVAVQFRRPVTPGSSVETEAWITSSRERARCVAFRTQDAGGTVVLSDGLLAAGVAAEAPAP